MKTKDKVITQNQLEKIREKHAESTIVFATGCFDVLHSGHAVFFEQCQKLGDVVVIGVARDFQVSKVKGEHRPVIPDKNRVHLVAAMEKVDYAILNEEEVRGKHIDFYNHIRELEPDRFYINKDNSELKEKRKLCDELNIEMKVGERTVPSHLEPMSTTEIVNKIASIKQETS